LGEDPGKGRDQPGRFAAAEDDRPATGIGEHGVVLAGLGMAAFGVPALADRLRTAVGDEVIVDEIDRVARWVGAEHPGGEGPLQPQRIAAVGERPQPGPERLELRHDREADRGAGVGPPQVFAALHRVDP